MRQKIIFFALILAAVFTFSACQSNTSKDTNQNNDEIKEEQKVNIKIEMQDGGIIKAELYPDVAPITVANFEKLINENFFDGLIFHRV